MDRPSCGSCVHWVKLKDDYGACQEGPPGIRPVVTLVWAEPQPEAVQRPTATARTTGAAFYPGVKADAPCCSSHPSFPAYASSFKVGKMMALKQADDGEDSPW